MFRTFPAAVVLLLVLAILVAACGSDPTPTPTPWPTPTLTPTATPTPTPEPTPTPTPTPTPAPQRSEAEVRYLVKTEMGGRFQTQLDSIFQNRWSDDSGDLTEWLDDWEAEVTECQEAFDAGFSLDWEPDNRTWLVSYEARGKEVQYRYYEEFDHPEWWIIPWELVVPCQDPPDED